MTQPPTTPATNTLTIVLVVLFVVFVALPALAVAGFWLLAMAFIGLYLFIPLAIMGFGLAAFGAIVWGVYTICREETTL